MHQASILMTFLVMLMGAAWLALEGGYVAPPAAQPAVTAEAGAPAIG
jgi:hypothetical protein